MQAQKLFPYSRVAQIVCEPDIALRETPRGFTIESSLDIAPCAARLSTGWRDKAIAGAAVAGVAALLFLPLGPFSAVPVGIKTLAGAIAAGAGLLGWSVFRRPERYVVEIDQLAEAVRISYLDAGATATGTRSIRFSEIRDIVVKRPRLRRAGAMTLCLRTHAGGRPVEIACGRDAVIGAIYNRLRRDLLPAEDRLATLCHRAEPSIRLHQIFPPIGPDEIAA